jgi:OFA family oxalate/formate antiporter-like MFS transporter
MGQDLKNHGVRVTSAAVGINLALGILYTWSVVGAKIPEEWGWGDKQNSAPYSVALLVFALVMVPAGRLQDKFGPRIVATLGGLLVGIGMILAGTTTSCLGYILAFGLLAGAGIGFGYASATPPAVKWFPAARTGLIAGIVVSGFGLASVYASPLATWLIAGAPQPPASLAAPAWVTPCLTELALAVQRLQTGIGRLGIASGIPSTMVILGGAFLIVVVALAQLLAAPPKGYVPAGAASPGSRKAAAASREVSPLEMLRTPQFYLLWFMYACGAGAGLMIISKLAKIATAQAGSQIGFLLVAALAVGNGAGRIIAGSLSDRLGRRRTLLGCFVFQAVLMILMALTTPGTILATTPALLLLSALMGANYGANLSIFPSVTKDYYGLKNFGVNYGLVFTAWGIGGFVLSLLAGHLYDIHKHYYYSYYSASALLLLAGAMTFAMRSPAEAAVVEAPSPPAPAPRPK